MRSLPYNLVLSKNLFLSLESDLIDPKNRLQVTNIDYTRRCKLGFDKTDLFSYSNISKRHFRGKQ
jgi:hypothetical protein